LTSFAPLRLTGVFVPAYKHCGGESLLQNSPPSLRHPNPLSLTGVSATEAHPRKGIFVYTAVAPEVYRLGFSGGMCVFPFFFPPRNFFLKMYSTLVVMPGNVLGTVPLGQDLSFERPSSSKFAMVGLTPFQLMGDPRSSLSRWPVYPLFS